jgi:hypothetical protein
MAAPVAKGLDRFPLAVPLAVVAAVVYWAATAQMLSASQLYGHYNLAFDFDPSRYINLLIAAPETWSARDAAAEFWVKHPFYLMHRPIAQGLMLIGFPPVWAVLGLSIITGVLTLLVFNGILRHLCLPDIVRAAALLLFAGSAAQVACITVPDAYSAALLGILLAIWMVMRRAASPGRWPVQRFLLPAYLFGVTATNLIFAGIAEFALQVTTQPLVRAIRNLVIWGIVSGGLIVVLLAICYPNDMLAAAGNPVQALKSVLWIGTLEPDKTIPPASLLTMVKTMFAFSLSAPAPSVVMIPGEAAGLPPIPMHDFRVFDYGSLGLVALLGWLTLLAFGGEAMLRRLWTREGLAIGLAVGAMLAFNLAFQVYFQYRGSVFLYAGHFFPAVAVVVAFGIARLHAVAGGRAAPVAGGLLAMALVSATNTYIQMDAIRAGIVAGGY